ncbi:MAG: hypothetical protein ACRCV9_10965 [Burkholderiaceae bacterium]
MQFSPFAVQCIVYAFMVSNTIRVLTYLPTIAKLRQPGASARNYSLLTWVCWMLANATTALYVYVVTGYRVDMAVIGNAVNTVMCAWVCSYIVRLRRREVQRSANAPSLPENVVRMQAHGSAAPQPARENRLTERVALAVVLAVICGAALTALLDYVPAQARQAYAPQRAVHAAAESATAH